MIFQNIIISPGSSGEVKNLGLCPWLLTSPNGPFFIFPTGWYGYEIELSHMGKTNGNPYLMMIKNVSLLREYEPGYLFFRFCSQSNNLDPLMVYIKFSVNNFSFKLV